MNERTGSGNTDLTIVFLTNILIFIFLELWESGTAKVISHVLCLLFKKLTFVYKIRSSVKLLYCISFKSGVFPAQDCRPTGSGNKKYATCDECLQMAGKL